MFRISNCVKKFHNKFDNIKKLHIHFENTRTVIRRTVISAVVITATATAVFGLDAAVTSILMHIG